METKLAKRVREEAMWQRVGYILQRRQKVAEVAHRECESVIVAGYLIRKFEKHVTTHCGKNAYGTSLLQKGRIKDHKHRTRRRTEATQNTFAHTVDQHRAWEHFRAQFVKGGSVYAKMSRSKKRDLRSAINEADLHVRTYGDYVGAFAIVKGE